MAIHSAGQLRVHLEVELQRIGAPEGEGLLLVELRAGQPHGAARELVGVAVPLQRQRTRRARRRTRGPRRGRSVSSHRQHAQLRARRPADGSAEARRQQLGAEADAPVGPARPDRLRDQPLLRPARGGARLRRRPSRRPSRRSRRRAASPAARRPRRAARAQGHPARGQHVLVDAGRLAAGVLQDQDGRLGECHRAESTVPSSPGGSTSSISSPSLQPPAGSRS